MKRRALLAVPALAALGSCGRARNSQLADGPEPTAGPGPSPAVKVVSAGGGTVPLRHGKVMLGAYLDLKGLSASGALALRRRQLGRDERIVHCFYSWTDMLPATLSYVPPASTLMVSWRGPHYTDVNGGGSDRLISAAAHRLASRRKPTLLRWGWDMNRDFYPWGGPSNGRNTGGYIAAYRRIRRIFDDAGADNVSWVWSPNWNSHPADAWNQYPNYYPGDEYVDWVGVSGYATTQTPGDMFDELYDTYAPRKPVMITEVACADLGGTTKPDWITSFAGWVRKRPAVGAAVWFDTDTHPGSAEKWRIDSTAASLRAYRAMADDPLFRG